MGYSLDRDANDLTARQREVLAHLLEGRKPIEIAEFMGISKQTLSRKLVELENKGWVKSSGDASRSRQWVVTSPPGQSLTVTPPS